jgi:hypothetical protein
LIAAHRQPWAAVGPVIANGNPATAVSWADYLMGYAPWLDPSPAGVVEHLPGHNSAYKRDVLMQYGTALGSMLQAESVMHRDLRARGYQLYLEPAARTQHLNISRLSSWLSVAFYSGRSFAAERARCGHWSLPRRLLYAASAPLIPFVRLQRGLRDFQRTGRQGELLPRVLPTLTLGLAVSAAGEAIGYALGSGDAPHRLAEYEFHRHRHVVATDKPLMAREVK